MLPGPVLWAHVKWWDIRTIVLQFSSGGTAFARVPLQAVEAGSLMMEHSLMLLCLAGIGFKFCLKLVRKSKKAKVCLNVSETALSITMELTEFPWVQSYQKLC